MPVDSGTVRNTQGINENRRAWRNKPVSGANPRVPRPPAGVRHVDNQPWDERALLTAATVMLLAGGAAAGTALQATRNATGALSASVARRGGRGELQDAVMRGPLLPPAGRGSSPAGLSLGPAAGNSERSFLPGLSLGLGQPLFKLAQEEALAVAEESGGGGSSLLWQGIAAWFANPCMDFDQYVNGFWKLQHPAGREMPSFFGEAKRAIAAGLEERLSSASPEASGAEGVIARIWANARSSSGQQWTSFERQLDAIAALSGRADVERHICNGMAQGRESLLGLERYFHTGIMVAEMALRPDDQRAIYQQADDDPEIVAYQERIAGVLASSGMAEDEAVAAAPIIWDMEKTLARAPDHLAACTQAEAMSELPGFPWGMAWQLLGLDPSIRLYTSMEACRQVDALLATRAVDDWKIFLRFQEARRAAHYLVGEMAPHTFLERLESARGGDLVLSAWYGDGMAPALARRATEIFDQVKAWFIDDLAASSLPAADRAVLQGALAAAELSVAYRGGGVDWSTFPASDDLLHDLQALAAMAVQEDIAIIGGADGTDAAAVRGHWLALGTHITDGRVRVSPAMLATLAVASDGPEAQWGTLGGMLGHELAHILREVPGLSPQGKALLEREDAAIQQRIGDLWVGPAQLTAKRGLDEAACDLRGISAARRAGAREAEAAGRRFDHPRFFMAAAAVHAANPTQAQLDRQLEEDSHPPGPFRAGLVRQMEAFDQAFGCEPRPTAPFGRILPRASPVPASPNSG